MPRGIPKAGYRVTKGKPSPIKGTRRVPYKPCAYCGTEFRDEKSNELHCSLRCSIDSGYRGRRISKAKGDKTGWVTPIHTMIRNSAKYKTWRKSVFERDDYVCVECGDKSSKGHQVILNADHIKQFAYYPELRFELSNGRTLCLDCHKLTDTYKNNKFRDKLGKFSTEQKYLGENI